MNAFPAELAARSCLLAGGGWLCAESLRRSSAAVRHALWAAVMCGLLALPFVMAAAPEMPVGWLAAPPMTAVVSSSVAGAGQSAADSTARATPATPIAVHPAVSWSEVAGAVWLLVMLALFAGLAADCRRAATTAAVDVPQVRGIVRPTILLPAWFDAQNAERRQAILLHERAHIERHDCLWLLMARAACAVYWWNPLVWRGARALRLVAEEAADDRALATMAATDYASHLVDSARELRASFALAGAMSYTSHLEGRVKAILDSRRPRRALSRRATVALAAAAAVALVPLAAVRLAPQAGAATQAAPAPGTYTVSVKFIRTLPFGSHVRGSSGDPVHLRITSVLRDLITWAYGITPQQLGHISGWAGSDLYSVEAMSTAPLDHAQQMAMLRQILADRFHLKLRQETRDLPVFLLEVAPGGTKFKALGAGETQPKVHDSADTYRDLYVSTADLVRQLNNSPLLNPGRMVIDRTGITGSNYEMIFSTQIDRVSKSLPNVIPDIESELGLRFVAAKAPLPYYDVLSASRPTAN